MQVLFKDLAQKDSCFKPGSTLCRGCMEAVAFNNLGKATDNGRKTVYTMGTFCGEVSTLAWPNIVAWGRGNESPETFEKSFGIIHNVFESAPTVAEAVRDVADALTEQGAFPYPINVVSNAGDGGTLAIGLRSFLHTIHRRSRVTLVVLLNEFYANTGFQYGPSTTLFADTATTPSSKASEGNVMPPINHIALAVTAGAGFVAQVSPAFPKDFADAAARALECRETAVIFVPAPCISGWKYDDGRTMELAKLVAQCGLFPVFLKEREKPGKVTHVEKGEKRREKLLHFMAAQRRFAHLVRWDVKTSAPVIQPGQEDHIGELERWIDGYLSDLGQLAQFGVRTALGGDNKG